MIKSTSKSIINGILSLVQTITYTNGTSVRRVLNPSTGIPESIVFIDKNGKESS